MDTFWKASYVGLLAARDGGQHMINYLISYFFKWGTLEHRLPM